jgi:hypothetical protein
MFVKKILHVLQDSDLSQYMFKRHGLCRSIKKKKEIIMGHMKVPKY